MWSPVVSFNPMPQAKAFWHRTEARELDHTNDQQETAAPSGKHTNVQHQTLGGGPLALTLVIADRYVFPWER